MALSTKFVPFLYAVLDQSGGAPKGAEQYFAGETLALNSLGGGEGEIINPDGKSSPISAGQTNFAQTMMPGVYQVKSKDKQMRFAVNLDANESKTAPVPIDELERFGAPLVPGQALESRVPGVSQAQLQNAELESRQKLWKWFIVGTLVLLLLETWLGGKTTRGLVRKEEAAV